MKKKELATIDDVILVLEEIILESIQNNDPLGYFASLYQRVTRKVKKGIEENYFEDGPRMEKLDILFKRCGVDSTELRTDLDYVKPLVKLFENR